VKAALALALLALCCGCNKRPAPVDAPSTMSAPSRTPDTATPSQANRFVVCPGDPRCPRRKDGRPAEGAN
jgi:hypothetical protein